MHCRDEVRVPAQVELHLQSLQAGVHQEHQQQEAVDDGETAEELSEGGADIVPREDNDGDGVDEDAEDTEAGEEDTLQQVSFNTTSSVLVTDLYVEAAGAEVGRLLERLEAVVGCAERTVGGVDCPTFL